MHGTNAGQVPTSSTPGPFGPGGERPLRRQLGTPKGPALHHPQPFVPRGKHLLECRQDPPVTHSLPLTTHEARSEFMQGFSAALFRCPPRERWVSRLFFPPGHSLAVTDA